MNAKTQKLFESAYGSAHVCAGITETQREIALAYPNGFTVDMGVHKY